MKRFNYEDDYEDENFYLDEDDDDIEDDEYGQLVDVFQLNLVQYELNQNLIAKTIAFLEKSWFWKFKSTEKKLKLIEETYNKFKELSERKEE